MGKDTSRARVFSKKFGKVSQDLTKDGDKSC